jgi:rhamnosyltransferase subunit B
MHFVFSTYGARGDVFPYILIGQKLQARGHRATIATSRAYKPEIEAAGLRFVECGPLDPTPEEQKLGMDPLKGFEFLIRRLLIPALPATIPKLRETCADADVLVSHTLSLAGPIVAELEAKRGLKWVSAQVSPLAMMSSDCVLAAAPWVAQRKTLNALVFKLLERQFGAFCKPVKKIRHNLGLPPGQNPLWNEAHSSLLQLCLWPQQFAASPTALNRVYTGFPLPEESAPLPSDITEFLNSGASPLVFVGASFLDPLHFAEQSMAAAIQLGKRALVLGAPASSTSDVIIRPFAPLRPIFERAEAIVYRGGIGTLALALQSGKPSVIAPATQDQPDNAHRAVRLGVAVQTKMEVGPLTQALQFALSDEDFRARCKTQGAFLTAQNGVDVAAENLIAVAGT